MNVWELFRLPGLERGLALVEEELHRVTASSEPLLAEVASHLAGAGGKRLRPALSLAAAAARGAWSGACEPPAEVVLGSACLELVHMGSLCHDDVIDQAGSRRGVESANARWGNLVAVLTGDFLLAKASEIAAGLGPEVVKVLATTIGSLCEGELAQLRHAFSAARPERSYFEVISSKTASLMSASASIGGLSARAPGPEVEVLGRFGHAFGMAFQIWDDIRDVVCTETELGKPAGQDMLQGTYTLPVIRALADPEAGAELAALLAHPLEVDELERARKLVLGTGAIASSIAEGRRWAAAAASAVASLPPPSARAGSGEAPLGAATAAAEEGLSAAVAARSALAEIAYKLFDDLAARALPPADGVGGLAARAPLLQPSLAERVPSS
jgi:heptaprenyl diphosphate synthase